MSLRMKPAVSCEQPARTVQAVVSEQEASTGLLVGVTTSGPVCGMVKKKKKISLLLSQTVLSRQQASSAKQTAMVSPTWSGQHSSDLPASIRRWHGYKPS